VSPNIYYLRQMFGPICPALAINSRRTSRRTMKRPPKPGQDRRFKMAVIEVEYLEQISTADMAAFIAAHVKSRGLKPKAANVARYKEAAPQIRFLTLDQIATQMTVLADRNPDISPGFGSFR
jgi:hypothetical protein